MLSRSLRVSSMIGLDCPRRIAGYLLQREMSIEESIPFNGYLLAGNIVHSITQSVLLNRATWELIEYNHSRLGYSLQDSTIVAMTELLQEWASFITNKRFPDSSDSYALSIALDRVEKQIPHMAKLSSELLFEDNGRIQSYGLADEYIVQLSIGRALLVGHIDIVAVVDEKLKLIELKTGREKRMDQTQLMIYGEIFSSAETSGSPALELWYTGSGKKKSVPSSSGCLLDTLKNHIQQTESYAEGNLPPPNKSAEDCSYCEYCKFIESLEQKGVFR